MKVQEDFWYSLANFAHQLQSIGLVRSAFYPESPGLQRHFSLLQLAELIRADGEQVPDGTQKSKTPGPRTRSGAAGEGQGTCSSASMLDRAY